jgi:uncharacterized protein YuzE
MAAVTYDRDGDVLHVDLVPGADGPGTEGEEVSPGITLLYDAEGHLIGIEITAASKTLAPGALDALPAAA